MLVDCCIFYACSIFDLMLVLLLLLLLFVLIELLFVLSRRCGFYYCSFAVNKNNGNILMKIAA